MVGRNPGKSPHRNLEVGTITVLGVYRCVCWYLRWEIASENRVPERWCDFWSLFQQFYLGGTSLLTLHCTFGEENRTILHLFLWLPVGEQRGTLHCLGGR